MHHHLYLLLFGAAIADDAHLDFERRVFADCKTGLGGLQQSDTAYVRELERGFGVDGMKNFLDGDGFRSELLKHGAQLGGYLLQTASEGVKDGCVRMTPAVTKA